MSSTGGVERAEDFQVGGLAAGVAVAVAHGWLTDAGYSVVACHSFDEARHQLTMFPPDILVTDIRLGAFNGLQLAILVAERPNIMAVVMSAHDDPTLRKEAAQCGARYLLKPFTREHLLTFVDRPSSGVAGV